MKQQRQHALVLLPMAMAAAAFVAACGSGNDETGSSPNAAKESAGREAAGSLLISHPAMTAASGSTARANRITYPPYIGCACSGAGGGRRRCLRERESPPNGGLLFAGMYTPGPAWLRRGYAVAPESAFGTIRLGAK